MRSESRFPVCGSLITWLRLTVTILITRLRPLIVASLLNLVLALASAQRSEPQVDVRLLEAGCRDLRQFSKAQVKVIKHLFGIWLNEWIRSPSGIRYVLSQELDIEYGLIILIASVTCSSYTRISHILSSKCQLSCNMCIKYVGRYRCVLVVFGSSRDDEYQINLDSNVAGKFICFPIGSYFKPAVLWIRRTQNRASRFQGSIYSGLVYRYRLLAEASSTGRPPGNPRSYRAVGVFHHISPVILSETVPSLCRSSGRRQAAPARTSPSWPVLSQAMRTPSGCNRRPVRPGAGWCGPAANGIPSGDKDDDGMFHHGFIPP